MADPKFEYSMYPWMIHPVAKSFRTFLHHCILGEEGRNVWLIELSRVPTVFCVILI